MTELTLEKPPLAAETLITGEALAQMGDMTNTDGTSNRNTYPA